jgi:PKD domain-containing protein
LILNRNESDVEYDPNLIFSFPDIITTPHNLIWKKAFNRERYNFGKAIWGDGTNFYSTGYTSETRNSNENLILIKFDENGKLIWNQTWGNSKQCYGMDLAEDGDFIYTTGTIKTDNLTHGQIFLVKWDQNGNRIWEKTRESDTADCGESIWIEDTFIYTLGNTLENGGYYDTLLIKWDQQGNIIWEKTWEGFRDDFGKSIWIDNSNIYTIGTVDKNQWRCTDIVVIKWDTDGNQIWNLTWGGDSIDSGESICGDKNNIYCLGTSNNFSPDYEDVVVIKIELNGNILWNKTWGGCSFDYGKSIYADENNLYTAGYSYDHGNKDYDMFLIKWDLDGERFWDQTWGDVSTDKVSDIWCNGQFIFAIGETANIENSAFDIIILKLDKMMKPISSFEFSSSNLESYFIFSGIKGEIEVDIVWDFGDNTTNSSVWNSHHHYKKPGKYSVRLLLFDKDQNSYYSEQTIEIFIKPSKRTDFFYIILVTICAVTLWIRIIIRNDMKKLKYTQFSKIKKSEARIIPQIYQPNVARLEKN